MSDALTIFDTHSLPRPTLGDRSLFPELAYGSFLAHAAISPTNQAIVEALSTAAQKLAQHGCGAFLHFAEGRERLRHKLAQFLQVKPDNIALTPGTSRGITDVALGLPLVAGDRILSFDGEFPANIHAYQVAAQAAGASLTLLTKAQPGQQQRILEEVEKELRAGARYLAVSAVQFQSGLRMPLEELGELCLRYEAFFLVDGIQALGSLPLAPQAFHADALMTGAHKWMLGMEGTGYSYLSPRLLEVLKPLTTGWLSFEAGEAFLFGEPDLLRYDLTLKKSAAVFEGSTTNTLGFVALEAAVDVLMSFERGEIFAHVQGLHNDWEDPISALGFRSLRGKKEGERSGLLSFKVPEDIRLGDLIFQLRSHGVMASSPDACLRLSPHFSNSPAEKQMLLDAIAASLHTLRQD